MVVILWSQGERTPEEREMIAQYQAAGATWWLEDVSLERFSSVKDARERLHAGSPRVRSTKIDGLNASAIELDNRTM